MLKLLHIGDVHFGVTLKSKNKIRDKIRASQRNAFSKAIDFAIEKKADLLLIAGDLFEHRRVETSPLLINHVNREISRAVNNGIKVVYATGNHDYDHVLDYVEIFGNKRDDEKQIPSLYSFRSAEIQTVRGVTRDGESYVLHTFGHPSKEFKQDIVSLFPKKHKDADYTVGMAHSNVEYSKKMDSDGNYAPTTLEHITRLDYDYFALGHIHIRDFLTTDMRVAYSGTLQATKSKEIGAKGGIFVCLDKGNITATPVDFSEFNYIRMDIDIPSHVTGDTVGDYILESIGDVETDAGLILNITTCLNLTHEDLVEWLSFNLDFAEIIVKLARKRDKNVATYPFEKFVDEHFDNFAYDVLKRLHATELYQDLEEIKQELLFLISKEN